MSDKRVDSDKDQRKGLKGDTVDIRDIIEQEKKMIDDGERQRQMDISQMMQEDTVEDAYREYDDNSRMIIERRRERAEAKRKEATKKRNMLLGVICILVALILVVAIVASTVSRNSNKTEDTVQVATTSADDEVQIIPETEGESDSAIEEETDADASSETTTVYSGDAWTSGTTVYSTDTLNMREEKSTDASILVQIPSDTQLSVISDDGEWVEVYYDGYQGYVMREYLTETSLEEE